MPDIFQNKIRKQSKTNIKDNSETIQKHLGNTQKQIKTKSETNQKQFQNNIRKHVRHISKQNQKIGTHSGQVRKHFRKCSKTDQEQIRINSTRKNRTNSETFKKISKTIRTIRNISIPDQKIGNHPEQTRNISQPFPGTFQTHFGNKSNKYEQHEKTEHIQKRSENIQKNQNNHKTNKSESFQQQSKTISKQIQKNRNISETIEQYIGNNYKQSRNKPETIQNNS